MMRDIRATAGVAAFFLCAALALAQRAPGAPLLGSMAGGSGGSGTITAVGDCVSGSCLTSGTTVLSGIPQFNANVDLRSSILNGGSATCFTGVTGVPCFTESVAIAPASGDGVVSFRFNASTNAEGLSFYDEGNVLIGGPRFYGSTFADADFANKMITVSVGKMLSMTRTDDVAAGTTVFEVRDNALAAGVQLFNVDGAGNIFLNASATRSKGSITLAAGTGTATVVAASICTCADTTAANACRVSLSGTTLTITGTGTDVVNYLCF